MADKSETKEPRSSRLGEIRAGFRAVKQLDPKVGWWMLGVGLLVFLIILGIGFAVGGWWRIYAALVGLPAGLLAASLVLNSRGNRAMYNVLEGQPGATGASLESLGRRGWYATREPVAMSAPRSTKATDMSGAAFIFRAVGRPGVVLISEGPKSRALSLLKTETKKVERLTPGVPIHTIRVGDDAEAGEIPLKKVSRQLTRMRPQITKAETAAVNKRLRAMTSLKPPAPAGVDPRKARVDRRAMRGK